MSEQTKIISWKEASSIFRLFTVYEGYSELRWFEKVWQDFIKMGLASYDNDTERHWILARIVTIGVMFDGFCYKAWGEHTDTNALIMELASDDTFNMIRLGSMVEKDWLSEDGDQLDLVVEAVDYLVCECRIPVYDALCKVFGDVSNLFVSLWLSTDESVTVGNYSDELFDSALEQDWTDDKTEAFDYVNDGMYSLDS